MRDSACRSFIVKKTNILLSYGKHFWILGCVKIENLGWLVYVNKLLTYSIVSECLQTNFSYISRAHILKSNVKF